MTDENEFDFDLDDDGMDIGMPSYAHPASQSQTDGSKRRQLRPLDIRGDGPAKDFKTVLKDKWVHKQQAADSAENDRQSTSPFKRHGKKASGEIDYILKLSSAKNTEAGAEDSHAEKVRPLTLKEIQEMNGLAKIPYSSLRPRDREKLDELTWRANAQAAKKQRAGNSSPQKGRSSGGVEKILSFETTTTKKKPKDGVNKNYAAYVQEESMSRQQQLLQQQHDLQLRVAAPMSLTKAQEARSTSSPLNNGHTNSNRGNSKGGWNGDNSANGNNDRYNVNDTMNGSLGNGNSNILSSTSTLITSSTTTTSSSSLLSSSSSTKTSSASTENKSYRKMLEVALAQQGVLEKELIDSRIRILQLENASKMSLKHMAECPHVGKFVKETHSRYRKRMIAHYAALWRATAREKRKARQLEEADHRMQRTMKAVNTLDAKCRALEQLRLEQEAFCITVQTQAGQLQSDLQIALINSEKDRRLRVQLQSLVQEMTQVFNRVKREKERCEIDIVALKQDLNEHEQVVARCDKVLLQYEGDLMHESNLVVEMANTLPDQSTRVGLLAKQNVDLTSRLVEKEHKLQDVERQLSRALFHVEYLKRQIAVKDSYMHTLSFAVAGTDRDLGESQEDASADTELHADAPRNPNSDSLRQFAHLNIAINSSASSSSSTAWLSSSSSSAPSGVPPPYGRSPRGLSGEDLGPSFAVVDRQAFSPNMPTTLQPSRSPSLDQSRLSSPSSDASPRHYADRFENRSVFPEDFHRTAKERIKKTVDRDLSVHAVVTAADADLEMHRSKRALMQKLVQEANAKANAEIQELNEIIKNPMQFLRVLKNGRGNCDGDGAEEDEQAEVTTTVESSATERLSMSSSLSMQESTTISSTSESAPGATSSATGSAASTLTSSSSLKSAMSSSQLSQMVSNTTKTSVMVTKGRKISSKEDLPYSLAFDKSLLRLFGPSEEIQLMGSFVYEEFVKQAASEHEILKRKREALEALLESDNDEDKKDSSAETSGEQDARDEQAIYKEDEASAVTVKQQGNDPRSASTNSSSKSTSMAKDVGEDEKFSPVPFSVDFQEEDEGMDSVSGSEYVQQHGGAGEELTQGSNSSEYADIFDDETF